MRLQSLRALGGVLVIISVAAPGRATNVGLVARPFTAGMAPQGAPAFTFVGGGEYNTVTGTYGTVGAGYGNHVTAEAASILGGYGSTAAGAYASIGGGLGNLASGASSVISGGADNNVKAAAPYAYIGGGYANLAAGQYSALAGGDGNTVNGLGASAVGGYSNNANSSWSFVGGGYVNTITVGSGGTNGAIDASIVGGSDNTVKPIATGGAANAFIGGGSGNTIEGIDSVIGGGNSNVASGQYATIPGGNGNDASGTASFAAGTKSAAQHDGTFVWSDDAAGASILGSTASNQFLARASGGFYLYSSPTLASGVKLAAGSGSWSTLSDRDAKIDVARVDDDRILVELAALPVSEWSYTAQGGGVRHLGPMAQDFHAAFGLGEDDRHISTVDEEGVALAAIKALQARVVARDRQLDDLRRRSEAAARADGRIVARLEARLDALSRRVQTLAADDHRR